MTHTSPIFSRFFASSALSLLVSVAALQADTLIWDPTGAITTPPGGTGTWNTSNQWSNGTADVAWGTSTTNPDIAHFNVPSAYTVTLNTAVYAGGLSITSTSPTVTLSGTGSVTLTGTVPKIDISGGQLSLNTVLQGSVGFEKTGAGVLRIGVAGNYSGDTKISAGQITSDVNNALTSTTTLTMAGSGIFSLAGKDQSVSGLTGTSGTTVRATANTGNFTVTAGSGTFAGSLNDGSGTARLNFTNSGGSLTLTGTSSYRGTTTVSGGTLSLGSNLTATSSVTVSGGTLTSTVANVNLGLGAFSLTGGALSANGASIGTFTLASGQNFTATLGTLNFTLGASNTSDQIIGSGAFNLSNLTLALNGTTSVAGSYTLFSGFTGNAVSGITITGLDPGYTGVLGTNGILTVSAIPEPSTFAALLGVSALGISVLRRRQTRA